MMRLKNIVTLKSLTLHDLYIAEIFFAGDSRPMVCLHSLLHSEPPEKSYIGQGGGGALRSFKVIQGH